MVHDGMVPRQLLFLIKTSLKNKIHSMLPVTTVSPEALAQQASIIRDDSKLEVCDKFHLLNDILIAGNLIPTESARFATFLSAIAAKVSVLNDGVSPLRSNLGKMLWSMNSRRQWAQILAANAIRYAQHLNDNWLALYFMHSRAVGFNARNVYKEAVTAFRRAINYLDSIVVPADRSSEASQLRARLTREMAVCRAKVTQHSRLATSEVIDSLNLANAIGEPQSVFDALNRCIEAFVYEHMPIQAEGYLDKLMSSWPSISDHSKAIAMKMHAKLHIVYGRLADARELIQKGLDFSLAHRFNHQIYHVKRLQWNLAIKDTNMRLKIIT